MKIIKGNLLDAKEQYIAHQCNCVTNKSAHLAKQVFTRFPFANIYASRTTRDQPGTIKISKDEQNKTEPAVINMLAQIYPGESKYPNDSYEKRAAWFQQCLNRISEITGLVSIAFPECIGCGSAGGCWQTYRNMIEKFEQKLPNVTVVLYRLHHDPQ